VSQSSLLFVAITLLIPTDSFDHALIEMALNETVKQLPGYSLFIYKSARIAQEGYIFANSAIAHCASLTCTDSDSIFKEDLESLMQVTGSAHHGSKDIEKEFRLIHSRFSEVCAFSKTL